MKIKIIIFACTALALAGCAKENTLSTGETAQAYLDLWLKEYHPALTPTSSGIYIMEETEGTGEAWNSENAYAYIETTIATLKGKVSSTSNKEMAQQTGTYTASGYYGPRYTAVGSGYSYAGLDAILDGMKVGGTRKAIVPSWLLTTSRYETQEEYIDNASTASHLIYTVTFAGQSNDIEATELALVTAYINANYPGAEPTTYITDGEADGTFYFITDTSAFDDDTPKRTDNAEATINYTGKLLDGSVFDTTVERTAKDARIYDSSRTYGPTSVTFTESYENISMGDSSDLIKGFKGGLSLMMYPGQKATVIFTSAHGYQSSGKSPSIPSWAPLIFELELVTADVETTEE